MVAEEGCPYQPVPNNLKYVAKMDKLTTNKLCMHMYVHSANTAYHPIKNTCTQFCLRILFIMFWTASF